MSAPDAGKQVHRLVEREVSGIVIIGVMEPDGRELCRVQVQPQHAKKHRERLSNVVAALNDRAAMREALGNALREIDTIRANAKHSTTWQASRDYIRVHSDDEPWLKQARSLLGQTEGGN